MDKEKRVVNKHRGRGCHYFNCGENVPDVYIRVVRVRRSDDHRRVGSWRFCNQDCMVKFFATEKTMKYLDDIQDRSE